MEDSLKAGRESGHSPTWERVTRIIDDPAEATSERTEQLFDLIETQGERYPVVCLTGTTSEPFLHKGQDKDIEEVLVEEAENNERFDIVLRFNPARPSLRFVPDGSDGPSGQKFAQYPVEIREPGRDNNFVMELFDKGLQQRYQHMDRYFISIVDQLITAMNEDENAGSLCVIIENAESLFPDGVSTSNEKSQNLHHFSDLSKLIARSNNAPKYRESDKRPHHRIILVDGSNKLGENDELSTHRHITVEPVPVLTSSDIRRMIEAEEVEATDALVQLAQGIPVLDLKKLLREHQGSSAQEVIDHLKFTKADAIRRQTMGALEFINDPRPLDTISLKPSMKRAIQTIAKQMKMGRWEEVPNLLLQGPPGTGKTIVAQALAVMLDYPYFQANDTSTSGLTDVEGDKWRAIIDTAIASKPCVLFIDELDKMIPKEENFGGMAGMGSNHYAKTIQYLQRKIGSGEMNGVVLVGATNYPENLSQAFGRSMRFGTRLAMLPPETAAEKIDIARKVKNVYEALKDVVFPDEFYEALIGFLDTIPYLTGADIEEFFQAGIGDWREACEIAEENGNTPPTLEEALLHTASRYFKEKDTRLIEERIEVAKQQHTYRVRTWNEEGDEAPDENGNGEAPGDIRELAEILDSLRDTETRLHQTRTQIQEEETKLSTVTAQASEKEAAVARLKEELAELKAEMSGVVSEAQEQLATAKEELETVTGQLNERQQTLTAEAEELEARLQQIRDTKSETEEALAEAQRQKRAAEGSLQWLHHFRLRSNMSQEARRIEKLAEEQGATVVEIKEEDVEDIVRFLKSSPVLSRLSYDCLAQHGANLEHIPDHIEPGIYIVFPRMAMDTFNQTFQWQSGVIDGRTVHFRKPLKDIDEKYPSVVPSIMLLLFLVLQNEEALNQAMRDEKTWRLRSGTRLPDIEHYRVGDTNYVGQHYEVDLEKMPGNSSDEPELELDINEDLADAVAELDEEGKPKSEDSGLTGLLEIYRADLKPDDE